MRIPPSTFHHQSLVRPPKPPFSYPRRYFINLWAGPAKPAKPSKPSMASPSSSSEWEHIHILGPGNLGNLVAHFLRSLPNPPKVTLLLYRHRKRLEFESVGSTIHVRRPHFETAFSTGFDVEVTGDERALRQPRDPGYRINNLIVTTKAHQTVAALKPIQGRISKDSTILFIQNGMGVIEEVKSKIFPDPASRPNFITGITTHGVYPDGLFSVVQRGHGTLQLGFVPETTTKQPAPPRSWLSSSFAASSIDPITPPSLSELPATTGYLIATLLSIAELRVSHIALQELLSTQLEKLAVNAVINPLTVIFDCRNGELLDSYYISHIMRILIFEISGMLRALPELDSVPGKELRFSENKIYETVIQVIRATALNYSSMLQDVRGGKHTEIHYISGYVVEKCKELGKPATVNAMMIAVVNGKQKIVQKRGQDAIPLEKEG